MRRRGPVDRVATATCERKSAVGSVQRINDAKYAKRSAAHRTPRALVLVPGVSNIVRTTTLRGRCSARHLGCRAPGTSLS